MSTVTDNHHSSEMAIEVVPVELELTATSIVLGQVLTKCVNLHRAAKNGDWNSVMNNPNLIKMVTNKITDKHETVLHIAAAFKQHNFVRSLVNYLKRNFSQEALKSFLETQNSNGNTALCYAALTGEVEIASLMVKTYESLGEQSTIGLPDLGTIKPVLTATWLEQKKMVEYLLDKILTLTPKDRHQLFIGIIRMGLYDKALTMIEGEDNAYLAAAGSDGDIALHVLARTPSAFDQKDQSLWRKCMNLGTKSNDTKSAEPSGVIRLVNKLIETAMSRGQDIESNEKPDVVIAQTLLLAAQVGNAALVINLLDYDPGLIWKVLPGDRTIFHIAIERRHESIFTLIHEFGGMKKLIAKNEVEGGNNMLHLAAQLAPQSKLNEVSGAALQMQREQFWFEEVKKVVEASLRNKENVDGKTPQVLFNEKHKELRHGGEKWMKDTAKSGMLVATLIATVTFAAIFSAPGGFDNFSGKPLLQNRKCFWIFWLSNATAWFSASTSIIMFLFILTSRYAEEDFLYSLPSKLTIGVTSLLVSVGSMMVAFCATFLLYYPRDFDWLIALLVVFPLLPLGYVSVKYPLLFDVIFSAYRSRLMFRWPKRLL